LKLTKSLIAALLLSLTFTTTATATPVKAGAVCGKVNAQTKAAGKTFVCKKSGKKLVWRVKAAKPAAAPVAPVTPTPTAPASTAKRLAIYTGGAGAGGEKSVELPASVTPTNTTANLKLWIYDPANKSRAIGSPGIWLRKSGEEWTWRPGANLDGTFYLNLAAGSYIFDTVEPNNNQRDYGRITYSLTVDAQGVAKIQSLQPNSAGFFSVTLKDNRITQPAFNPTSRCQLKDTGQNPGMNVGFPKSLDRLTSTGVIRALILPIDFPQVPGKGEPAEVFYQMATDTDNYFKAMSGNRVSFDFKTLASWHRADFDPAKFNLGTWGAGDPSGYYNAALASVDSVVDYSQFDVVYVLSPKDVPWSLIAYGPAFPDSRNTNDGPIKNGTISGADAYQQNGTKEWQWMAHETGHLFGIYDLYTIAPLPNVYGDWDLMSNNWGDLLELNSWNRYTQSWLTDSQVKCLESDLLTTTEVLVSPLNIRNNETKAVAVRFSDTQILVAEVRRDGGYDKLASSLQGVLVYLVDTSIPSIKGGYQTQRRPGSTNERFLDAALRPGDKIRVGSVQIEVVSSGASGDLVRISK